MSLVELFDADRLRPPSRWTALHPALLPVLAVAGTAVWGYSSHAELQLVRAQRQGADAQLTRLEALSNTAQGQAAMANRQAMIQRADRLEAELAALDVAPDNTTVSLPPSGWLSRLERLGGPRISLTKIEIDRGGAARVEGMALDAQAVSNFVGAWTSHEAMAAFPPRALDVQQTQNVSTRAADAAANASVLLRFVVRGAAWPDASAARVAGPAAATSAPGPGAQRANNPQVQP